MLVPQGHRGKHTHHPAGQSWNRRSWIEQEVNNLIYIEISQTSDANGTPRRSYCRRMSILTSLACTHMVLTSSARSRETPSSPSKKTPEFHCASAFPWSAAVLKSRAALPTVAFMVLKQPVSSRVTLDTVLFYETLGRVPTLGHCKQVEVCLLDSRADSLCRSERFALDEHLEPLADPMACRAGTRSTPSPSS